MTTLLAGGRSSSRSVASCLITGTAALCLLAATARAEPPAASYTWYDGDDARKAFLDETHVAQVQTATVEPTAVVPGGGSGAATASVHVKLVKLAAADRARVARGQAPRAVTGPTVPVFTEVKGNGRRMVLAGNAMLWLDVTFDAERCAGWLREQGLSSLGPIPGSKNGFVVAAPAGLPSLELANTLRSRPGVRAASPVWWKQASPR